MIASSPIAILSTAHHTVKSKKATRNRVLDIEPSLGKGGKIPGEVGLAKLKIDAELFRDLSPQLNADARPGAVGVPDIEWRANGDADDKLLLWDWYGWQWRRKVLIKPLRSAHGQN